MLGRDGCGMCLQRGCLQGLCRVPTAPILGTAVEVVPGHQVSGMCTCVCTCACCMCVCTWGRAMRPPAWLLPSKVLNQDLRASGAAAAARPLMQSFGCSGEPPKNPRWGVKRGGGGEELLGWARPYGSVALSLCDRGACESPLPAAGKELPSKEV